MKKKTSKHKVTKRKIPKKRSTRSKRKNPIDTEFLRVALQMSAPLGLPENSYQALNLGIQVGKMRIFKICKSGDSVTTWGVLRKVEERFDKNKLRLFMKDDIELDPSDAFMLGLYKGLIDGGHICLDKAKVRSFLGGYGVGSTKILDQLMENIRQSSLYKTYYLPIEDVVSVTRPTFNESFKAYFMPTPSKMGVLPPSRK